MSDQADVSLVRRGIINYTIVRGDTFAPPPVAFSIDGNPEDFTGASLTLTIRTADRKRVLFTLTEGSGISAPATGQLQYYISASDLEDADLPAGLYRYDVQKDLSGVRSTIQAGTITFLNEITVP